MEMRTIEERLTTELTEAKQEQQKLNQRLEDRPSFGLGEGATLAYSWEMALARQQELERRIEALQQALQRLDTGTYGQCEHCKKPIDPERLEILPEATTCPQCAEIQ